MGMMVEGWPPGMEHLPPYQHRRWRRGVTFLGSVIYTKCTVVDGASIPPGMDSKEPSPPDPEESLVFQGPLPSCLRSADSMCWKCRPVNESRGAHPSVKEHPGICVFNIGLLTHSSSIL